jgi:cytochrome o ubiquinol oxidase operon protein cyoD
MKPFRILHSEVVTYGIGYILALSLTVAAFILTYFRLTAAAESFEIILGLAFVQIVVHMRCFLHMSLQRSSRADLMLVLFSALIMSLMVGGTLVVLSDLRMRMM